MSTNHTEPIRYTKACITGTGDRKEITKSIDGCSIVIRFPSIGNKQALTVAKELMIDSYTEKLFCKNF